MDLPVLLKGPVNTSRRKDDLRSIAEALKISQDGTVKELVARLKAYLLNNSEALSTQPQFQGLYSYRPDSKLSGRPPKDPAPKTSVDKAVEDAEASRMTDSATG